MPALTSVEARISEETPRDLRGVRMLREALGEAVVLEGRDGPFGRTPWEEDLAASRDVLAAAGARVAAAEVIPVTLATDCSLALGTLPALAPDVRVLWLDAHADYDTPATSTLSFLGCMSLAGACGEWDSGLGAIDPGRVVHVGARGAPGEFDWAGEEALRRGAATVLGVDDVGRAVAALGAGEVYVHLDPDVLDPAVNPIPYGRPGGLGEEALLALLTAVAGRGPVAGIEVTAFHSSDDAEVRARMCALLVRAIRAVAR